MTFEILLATARDMYKLSHLKRKCQMCTENTKEAEALQYLTLKSNASNVAQMPVF